MKKIVHYEIEVETEESVHPGVLKEELLNLFDPLGIEPGALKFTLLRVSSKDWNKRRPSGVGPL